MLEQEQRPLEIAIVCCKIRRGASGAIGAIRVGSARQQQSHHRGGRVVPLHARGYHEGRLPLLIGRVDVGAFVDQCRQALRLTHAGRQHQRASPILQARLPVGSASKQKGNQRRLIGPQADDLEERRPAFAILCIHIGAAHHQEARHPLIGANYLVFGCRSFHRHQQRGASR